MRYSIEPRERIYVKGYGFLSFGKNMSKNLSNKYGQKLLGSTRISATDAVKTASNRAIQKSAEATGDLIGSKIADKITSFSKKSPKELHFKELQNNEMEAPKKHAYLQKKDNKLLMN